MRGKAKIKLSFDLEYRITPAYAGKSPVPVHLDAAIQDHPRLCGEKFDQMCFFCGYPGSPPPMRGKVYSQLKLLGWNRITPAYAGKSCT